MKHNAIPVVVLFLLLLGCKDPFDYEHRDPNLPDPPAAPTQTYPPDGKEFKRYGYPQPDTMRWNPVPGAEFYQVEVFTDSVLIEDNLYFPMIDRVHALETAATFYGWGFYYWRVRGDSPRRWNAPTDWSPVRMFLLPNPTD